MAVVIGDNIHQVLATPFCFLGHKPCLWGWTWASDVRAGVTMTDAHHNTNVPPNHFVLDW